MSHPRNSNNTVKLPKKKLRWPHPSVIAAFITAVEVDFCDGNIKPGSWTPTLIVYQINISPTKCLHSLQEKQL